MRKATRQFPGATHYKDQHGKRRWRYRKRGFSAELGTDYGSDEFVARYEAAVEGQRAKGLIGSSRTVPGSFSDLVARYYCSPAFLALSESTRRTYRGVIEPLRANHGHKQVSHMKHRHVLELMAEKVETPAAANNLRKRVMALMNLAIKLEWRKDNPAAAVKPYRIAGTGFHTWGEHEISRFLEVHPSGSTAHLAMTLMLYTGAARADAVRLGWGNVRDGRLSYRRLKTEGAGGELIDIPMHPELEAVLAALRKGQLTFLETAQGRSRSPNGLGNAMRAWCDTAGLPECSSHGLRKACARRLAEAGATANEIAAVTGHKSLAEVSRYTRQADRAGLADSAIEKLTGTDRKQNVTNLPGKFVKFNSKRLNRKDK